MRTEMRWRDSQKRVDFLNWCIEVGQGIDLFVVAYVRADTLWVGDASYSEDGDWHIALTSKPGSIHFVPEHLVKQWFAPVPEKVG